MLLLQLNLKTMIVNNKLIIQLIVEEVIGEP